MNILSVKEDQVTRRVTKFEDEETSQTIIMSEFIKDDQIIGRLMRSDSLDFNPTRDLLDRMRDAVIHKQQQEHQEALHEERMTDIKNKMKEILST
jgi:hypothetical protein